MSEPTKGGLAVKVLTGRSALELLKYRDNLKEKQEGYLFSASRNCSHDVQSQIAEFKAVRVEHGTDGAKRTARARHETVDPETGLHASGQMGTHVNEYSGGRMRKRPVRPGETPTHLRIEAGAHMLEKESEATHTIYAFGADLVNPDNPEDLQRAFDAVVAEREKNYPGLQESLWLERNGESRLAHVHVASNATIYADFTLDGVDYRAGQKMAGDLTRVDSVRARSDRFLDEHPEFGFSQSLARFGTKEYEDAQKRDGQKSYWEQKRGKESNQDQIRRNIVETLIGDGVHDRDSFVAEMNARGVEVKEVGLRRGVPTKNHDYSYVAGAKQGVKGKTLGVEYGYDAIGTQLDLKALGQEIEAMDDKQRVGEARKLPFETVPMTAEDQHELNQLRAQVDGMAQAERDRQSPAVHAGADQQAPSPRSEADRRLAETRERQAARLEELKAQSDATHLAATEGARQRQAAQAADKAEFEKKRQQVLDSPPAAFAGLSERELARLVDQTVVVRDDYTAGHSAVRTDDLVAMRREHGMPHDEANYLATKWWALGRPTTAQERGELIAESAPRTKRATPVEPVVVPAVVEPELQTPSSAAAPDEAVIPSAAAPAMTTETEVVEVRPEPVFRSKLRSVKARGGSKAVQQRIDGLAQLEEDYHGKKPDAEFELRIKGFGGINDQFLATYGEHIDPTIREQLELRAEKMQAARDSYEAAKTAREQRVSRLKTLQASGEADAFEGDVVLRQLDRTIKTGNEHATLLRAELTDGDYECHDRERQVQRDVRNEATKKKVSQRAAELVAHTDAEKELDDPDGPNV